MATIVNDERVDDFLDELATRFGIDRHNDVELADALDEAVQDLRDYELSQWPREAAFAFLHLDEAKAQQLENRGSSWLELLLEKGAEQVSELYRQGPEAQTRYLLSVEPERRPVAEILDELGYEAPESIAA